MNQIEDVLIEPERLRRLKLIDAASGSLIYESDGRIVLRADKAIGSGIAQKFGVSPFTFEVELLESSDLDQREGAAIIGLAFRVDPNSAKVTSPNEHEIGDLIVAGNSIKIVAKAPNDRALPLILRATLQDEMPLSYSAWAMGIQSPEGEFSALFRKHDL